MLLCIFFFFFLVIYVIDLNICCLLHDCCFTIKPKHPLGFVVGGTRILCSLMRGEEVVNLNIF